LISSQRLGKSQKLNEEVVEPQTFVKKSEPQVNQPLNQHVYTNKVSSNQEIKVIASTAFLQPSFQKTMKSLTSTSRPQFFVKPNNAKSSKEFRVEKPPSPIQNQRIPYQIAKVVK